ncbi:hypothetical protein HK099_007180 [Clydaea vesicula]|uniref:C2H2-type domain-containing protein n=1 Tax=Clydaea vesicula TaxID=447962 RepID=A0AAD5TWP3_9FUNG|nr:hypothetical protein HK099_007180 [Clydaea vesicula]KAJ3393685.1 hypothetical protein HDU92_007585 [Lobulomyces angularis]
MENIQHIEPNYFIPTLNLNNSHNLKFAQYPTAIPQNKKKKSLQFFNLNNSFKKEEINFGLDVATFDMNKFESFLCVVEYTLLGYCPSTEKNEELIDFMEIDISGVDMLKRDIDNAMEISDVNKGAMVNVTPSSSASPDSSHQDSSLDSNYIKSVRRNIMEDQVLRKEDEDGKVFYVCNLVSCPKYNVKVKRRGNMLSHLKTHLPLHVRRTIRCPQCSNYFSSMEDLKRHIKSIHGEIEIKCSYCEYVDKNYRRVKTHEKTCKEKIEIADLSYR